MQAEQRARTESEESSFLVREASWADVGFRSSREKLGLEVAYLVVMSCRKQRQQMDGEGGSGGKVEHAEIEENEDDDVEEDEEELSDEEETDGSQAAYKKNRWRVVVVWTNVTKKEAYRQAAEIITADFNIVYIFIYLSK